MAERQLGTAPSDLTDTATKGYVDAAKNAFSGTVGNGTLTVIPVTHNLGTMDVITSVHLIATGEEVECDVVKTNATTVTLTFAAAPAASSLRVTVIGTAFANGAPIPTDSTGITDSGTTGRALIRSSNAADAQTAIGLTGAVSTILAGRRVVQTVTAPASLDSVASKDYVILIGSGGAPILPTAAGNTSRYTLKNIDTASRTVATTGGQTIDGVTPLTLLPGQSVGLISDGTNWRADDYLATATGKAVMTAANAAAVRTTIAATGSATVQTAESLGIPCDGVTDAAPFINALPQETGIIHFSGTMLCKTPLTIPHGVTLKGKGRAVWIDGASIILFDNTVDWGASPKLLTLGVGTNICFATRVVDAVIDAADIPGSIAVYSKCANEQSGLYNVLVRRAVAKGVYVDGSLFPVAQNWGMADLEIIMSSTAAAGVTTAVSGTGTTATLTLASTPNVCVGESITVSGVTPSGYNGTYTVTATSGNSVSYACAATGSQTVAGTVSRIVIGIDVYGGGTNIRGINGVTVTNRSASHIAGMIGVRINSVSGGAIRDLHVEYLETGILIGDTHSVAAFTVQNVQGSRTLTDLVKIASPSVGSGNVHNINLESLAGETGLLNLVNDVPRSRTYTLSTNANSCGFYQIGSGSDSVLPVSTNMTEASGKGANPRVGTLCDVNGNFALYLEATTSASNYLYTKNAASGTAPLLRSAGNIDSAVGLTISTKGVASIVTTDGTGAFIANLVSTADAKNYLRLLNAVAGSAATINATSATENNVSLDLTTKGTGTVRANGVPVATTANIQNMVTTTNIQNAVGSFWMPSNYVSGNYYFCQAIGGQSTNGSLVNSSARAAQWVVTDTISVTKLFMEFTVAGEANSVFRIGVWSHDASTGKAGSLVLDAGSISTGSGNAGGVVTGGTPGVYECSVTLTLTPGVYWVGGAVQGASTTQPTLRTWNGGPNFLPLGTSLPPAGGGPYGVVLTGQTGAFGSMTGCVVSTAQTPRIGFKVA